MKLKGMFLVGILLICAVFAATIELTVWTHEDPNRTLLEERYIEEFQKLYPEVSVKRVTYPSAKIKETVLTAFSAGKGPDIFNMEVQDEYPYIVNRRVAPVNPAALGYKNVGTIRLGRTQLLTGLEYFLVTGREKGRFRRGKI